MEKDLTIYLLMYLLFIWRIDFESLWKGFVLKIANAANGTRFARCHFRAPKNRKWFLRVVKNAVTVVKCAPAKGYAGPLHGKSDCLQNGTWYKKLNWTVTGRWIRYLF